MALDPLTGGVRVSCRIADDCWIFLRAAVTIQVNVPAVHQHAWIIRGCWALWLKPMYMSVSRVTTMLRVAAVNVDEAAARVYMGVEFDKNM